MSKKLDVIIPAYNAHKTLAKTLSSIAMQNCVDDLRVTLVNDAGKSHNDIIRKFERFIDIREISYITNVGPGGARQYGIEHTTLPYIAFIDADDTFASAFSLSLMLQEFEADPNLKLVFGMFVEQVRVKEGWQFVNHDSDQTWVHGKIYSREHIEKFGIKFPLLRQNEDACFNLKYFNTIKEEERKYMNICVYNWQWADNTLTRGTDYKYKGYEGWCTGFGYAIDYLCNLCEKDPSYKKNLYEITSNYIMVTYLQFCEFAHTRKPEELLTYLSWVRSTSMGKMKDYVKEIPDSTIQTYYLTFVQIKSRSRDLYLPVISFNDFLSLMFDPDKEVVVA